MRRRARACCGCRRVRALRIPAGPPLRMAAEGSPHRSASRFDRRVLQPDQDFVAGLSRSPRARSGEEERAQRAVNGARRFEIWLGFAGVGAIATLLLGVAGQMMARRIGLQELGGIWVGCLASFAGSLAGAVPLAQEVTREHGKTARRPLAERGDRSHRQGQSLAAAGEPRGRTRRRDEWALGTSDAPFCAGDELCRVAGGRNLVVAGPPQGGEDLRVQD